MLILAAYAEVSGGHENLKRHFFFFFEQIRGTYIERNKSEKWSGDTRETSMHVQNSESFAELNKPNYYCMDNIKTSRFHFNENSIAASDFVMHNNIFLQDMIAFSNPTCIRIQRSIRTEG